jgi:serine/threonine protein kinase
MVNLIGKSIGRYQIIEQLGQGGMALVFKACDTRLDRFIAIKIIRMDALMAQSLDLMLKRFEIEARALAKLSHPNIVPIYDYGEYEGAPYLVMQYLPGGVLNLKHTEPMPWQEAVRTILPIAHALAYAHEHNIIHRDIKPSNILLTEEGVPMLSDFGIAKILESNDGATLTGGGMTTGTPDYMAPEQWVGQTGPLSDLYSLGMVMFELVTGSKPYTADTPVAVMLKQINDPLPAPRLFRPDLPVELENIMVKVLAAKPEDRYSNMAEFADELEKLEDNQIFPVLDQVQARPEDAPIQADREVRPEPGKDLRLGGAGVQPPTGAIPASPTPREQPAPRASRPRLWAALGVLVVLLLLGAAVWFAFLNPGQKGHAAPSIPITGPATASLAATSTVIYIPITSSSPTPAISPATTIAPTSTITFTPTPAQITVLWDISHGPRVSLDGLAYTPDGMYKPLVQALAKQNFVVTSGGLSGIDSNSILVLSAPSANLTPYTNAEADAIEKFVRVAGHGLLIMNEVPGFDNRLQTISQRFGIDLGTTSSGGPVKYSDAPFFSGVSSLQFLYGGGVLTFLPPALPAAWDQKGNPVIAYCACDAGRVLVVADSSLWDKRGIILADNQQFAKNVFQWLAKSSP